SLWCNHSPTRTRYRSSHWREPPTGTTQGRGTGVVSSWIGDMGRYFFGGGPAVPQFVEVALELEYRLHERASLVAEAAGVVERTRPRIGTRAISHGISSTCRASC